MNIHNDSFYFYICIHIYTHVYTCKELLSATGSADASLRRLIPSRRRWDRPATHAHTHTRCSSKSKGLNVPTTNRTALRTCVIALPGLRHEHDAISRHHGGARLLPALCDAFRQRVQRRARNCHRTTSRAHSRHRASRHCRQCHVNVHD